MAAYHLTGHDAVAQLSVSTASAVSGAAPSYGTPLVLAGDWRNFSVKEALSTVEVSGMGDQRQYHRTGKGGTTITLEKFVLSTGYAWMAKLGYYGKLEIKEITALSYTTYEGLITELEWSGGDDEPQLERLTILCDAEHA